MAEEKKKRIKTSVVQQLDGVVSVIYPDEVTAKYDVKEIVSKEVEDVILKPENELALRLLLYGYWQKVNDAAALPKGSTWDDKRAAQKGMHETLKEGKWAERRVSKTEREKFMNLIELKLKAKVITKKQYEEAVKLADTLYPG